MSFWHKNILLLAVVILGAILAQALPIEKSQKFWSRRFVPFGGAFLFGVVVLHIFPEVYATDLWPSLGLFVLLGFVIQITLDTFSRGIEHGHLHVHGSQKTSTYLTILLGLCLHAFLEGLPMDHGHFHANEHGADAFFWGIVLHKLPAAFTLAAFLILSKVSRQWMFLAILCFGLMTPLGHWIGHSVQFSDFWRAALIAIVAGSLLHVSTTIIFEVDAQGSHQISADRIFAILLGLTLAYISTIIGST